MKKVFEQYSNYYDKLYSTKDYSAECDYLEKIINQFSDNKNKNLLDLGCGTGGHSIILAKRGWNVTGIDRSDDMINIAKEKRNSVPIDFRVSDIRDFSSDKKFNVAISMFAVVSYLISNEDLLIFFKSVKNSLDKNGLFIFDAWFGPAVLFEKPSDRYTIIENKRQKIIRLAHSDINLLEHFVTVNYKIFDFQNNKINNEVNEIHKMRYFFPKEIELYLSIVELKLIALYPFLGFNKAPSENDWNVTFVAKSI